jgi:lysophospholipase L1-like esterase
MRAIEPQSNKKPTRRAVLAAITCAVPLAVFALTELGLRAAGAGELEPLFVAAPQAPGYLQPNPDFVQRFFANRAQAPQVSIDTTYFERDKPADTLRIFVQGESSAAGFPYGRWASPGAVLQQRLQRGLPERQVQVITVAMAAVTTYVLLDQVDEILAQQPDAVVIYTGHNEFLGIGGVGSSLAASSSPALARLTLQLRRLRLYRVIERAIAPADTAVDRSASADATLMARIAAKRQIALDSDLFRRAEEQFRGNLARILERYRRAGVPVFIGTLASNERDQPPFASAAASAGEASASVRFDRARALEASGRYAEARAEYRAAKDRDELRFRAPESFNAIIRSTAASHGATLVDVQSALAARSRNTIIGNDLMLEHLHPNLDGYFALASAYYAALPPAIRGNAEVSDAMAHAEMPATEIERLGGEYRLRLLKNDWPFVPERVPTTLPAPQTPIESIAQRWFGGQLTWPNAMNEAMAQYQQQGNANEVARIAANLAEAFVNLAAPQQAAAVVMLRADQAERALPFAARAARLEPASPDYLLTLAEAQFRAGRVAQSEGSLLKILARDPSEPRATYWLRTVRQHATVPN